MYYPIQTNDDKKIRLREKMMGHHIYLRESGDLPLWPKRKNPPFSNVLLLITREILRNRDAQ